MQILTDLRNIARACDMSVIDLFRLKMEKRYVSGHVKIFGRMVEYVDACTLLEMLQEIFVSQCYLFPPNGKCPHILDCGANVGISVLFFKTIFPDAHVIALEADPDIFDVLKRNVAEFGFRGVTLLNSAAWTDSSGITFRKEGGLSGRIPLPGDAGEMTKVNSVRVKELLLEPMDLLKIDVEGVETAILEDCRQSLGKVGNLFVEYHSHESKKQDLHQLLEILADSGFRYHVKPAFTVEQPFMKRRALDGMDMQLNIYAWRDRGTENGSN